MEPNEQAVAERFYQVEGQGNPPDLESVTTTNATSMTILAVGGGKDPQEDLQRTLGLLDIKNKLASVKEFRNKVKAEENSLIEDEDDMAHIDDLVRQYTEEQIKEFSNEELDEIYTSIKTGEKIVLHNLAQDKEYIFKKDFLLYKKNSQEYLDKIDEEQAKFEQEYAESEGELNELLEKFEDMNLVLRERMVEVYTKSEDPVIIKRYGLALDAFDNAFSLQCLFDNYIGMKKSNQINDYKLRGKQIYNKFLKRIRILKLRTDLSIFRTFEISFLDKKFHYYTDFFLFLVFKFILHRKGTISRSWEGTFLTQLTINLKRLYEGKMKPADKESFLSNVTKVLDLFDGFYTIDKNFNKEDMTMTEQETVPVVEEVVETPVEEVTEVCEGESQPCECEAPVEEVTGETVTEEVAPTEEA